MAIDPASSKRGEIGASITFFYSGPSRFQDVAVELSFSYQPDNDVPEFSERMRRGQQQVVTGKQPSGLRRTRLVGIPLDNNIRVDDDDHASSRIARIISVLSSAGRAGDMARTWSAYDVRSAGDQSNPLIKASFAMSFAGRPDWLALASINARTASSKSFNVKLLINTNQLR